VAIAHARFERKRIDSVIAALVGVGRGYDVEVDHVARMIRIVATIAQSPPQNPSTRSSLNASCCGFTVKVSK